MLQGGTVTFTAEISTVDALRVRVVIRESGVHAFDVILPESALIAYLDELSRGYAKNGDTMTITRGAQRPARRRA